MKKGLFSAIGFVFFIVGMWAIVLSLVGTNLSFMVWLDSFGKLGSFLFKVFMVVAGILILIISRGNFSGNDEEELHL